MDVEAGGDGATEFHPARAAEAVGAVAGQAAEAGAAERSSR